MQKALPRLWEMYEGVNNAKMEHKIKLKRRRIWRRHTLLSRLM
jgi:hypothetical protein